MNDRTIVTRPRRGKAVHIAAEPAWGTPPQLIETLPDEVHLWRAFLDIAPSQVQTLSQVLSLDEQERAGRFRFPCVAVKVSTHSASM